MYKYVNKYISSTVKPTTAYFKITEALQQLSNSDKAIVSQRFFKTGPGQYGEGDTFIGVMVPEQRQIAKQFFASTDLKTVEQLLYSSIHENRLVGLLILTYQFPKASSQRQQMIFDFYLAHRVRVNNWDLVDLSAPNIIGEYMLRTKLDMQLLKTLAGSAVLWERRISIITTLAFIRAVKKQRVNSTWLQPSLDLSHQLLHDPHDLMHKAVGWVLREVGKVDEEKLRIFLDQHVDIMPRTMLRYSIEKFDEETRLGYLHASKMSKSDSIG